MAKIELPIRNNTYNSLLSTVPTPAIQSKLSVSVSLDDKKTKEMNNKVKVAALTGSVLTTLLYLFAITKGAKTGNFKFADMFKVKYDTIKAIGLATSAMLGGFAGGMIVDKKENQKPKIKEAIHQFCGNIITPITIVGVATNIINKQGFPRWKNGLYGGIAAILGVGLGVTGGNKIATKINEKIFKEDDNRKVGIKDFGIHVDDLMTVLSMADLGEAVERFAAKFMPLVFLVCGYEAGTKNVNSLKKTSEKNPVK